MLAVDNTSFTTAVLDAATSKIMDNYVEGVTILPMPDITP
jgi:hypothetical protein